MHTYIKYREEHGYKSSGKEHQTAGYAGSPKYDDDGGPSRYFFIATYEDDDFIDEYWWM